jgi:hypothetical protein
LRDGAASTFFRVDPTNDTVFSGMIQRCGPGMPPVQLMSRPPTYQALLDPSK